jgi:hypothetical protein
VRPPYVFAAESSAALDAPVYAGYYPGEVAGFIFVDGVHPDLLIEARPDSGKMAGLPPFVFHSQDAVAQVMNGIGVYRLGLRKMPPPTPPQGISSTEWNTIWSLSQSSKARSALVQEIASWRQSATQVKSAGNLVFQMQAVGQANRNCVGVFVIRDRVKTVVAVEGLSRNAVCLGEPLGFVAVTAHHRDHARQLPSACGACENL